MKTNNELIEEYYRSNPEAEVRHRKSEILEFGLPPAIGAAAGSLIKKGPLRTPLAGAGAGFSISIPLSAVRRAHRRKKILEQMGVDESILGSFMEPIKREI